MGHIATLLKCYLNGDAKHAAAGRLKRTVDAPRYGAKASHCATMVGQLVTVGAGFVALVTVFRGKHYMCSATILGFSACAGGFE